MPRPSILFLSALDFKEKSIQVIRKTPEAFRDAGWKVTYLVARDTSRDGDYFYERVVDISGMRVIRMAWPLAGLQDKLIASPWNVIVSKLRGYLTVVRLTARAAAVLLGERFDVIYGYEAHGVLAVCLLRFMGLAGGSRIVSRFQGFKRKTGIMALLNWEMFAAMIVPSHLCIMTDDGTQGDRVLRAIGSPNYSRMRFWVNGVDPLPPSSNRRALRRLLGCKDGEFLIVSVSRLVAWKRIDRGIRAVEILVKRLGRRNVRYCIIGGGSEKEPLQSLVDRLGLRSYVCFRGPLEHEEALKHMQAADAFLSAYDLSNVGNPLLEAIRAGLPIFTLDNGDTGRWIKHGLNGFIYPPEDGSVELMALDMSRLISDPILAAKIKTGLRETVVQRLWSWRQRLAAEVSAVGELLSKHP